MPSLVTLPFIQCHQVCGLAESGGLRKPVSSGSARAVDAVKPRQSKTDLKKTGDSFIIVELKGTGDSFIMSVKKITAVA